MSNTLFSAMKDISNKTETANGMAAHKSTNSALFDLFYEAPSHRNLTGPHNFVRLKDLVLSAFVENPEQAMKLLFYIRDIRGGAGERNVFHKALNILITNNFAKEVCKVLKHIPEYGRWDDLINLYGIKSEVDEKIAEIILGQFARDMSAYCQKKYTDISLLAKWLPSCNASSKATCALASKIRKNIFKISEKEYRQMLVTFRKIISIVEHNLMNKDYKTIEYPKLPGKALMKYRKAFIRNDIDNFSNYLNQVDKKKVKMNTKTLYPYDIVSKFIDPDRAKLHSELELKQFDLAWQNLPNYFGEDAKHHNWLAVVDTSGSMFGGQNPQPIEIAISIGLYTAEHNEGLFKNKFITFSYVPELVELKEHWSLRERVANMKTANWAMNTDLIAVFELILSAATKHNIPETEMPETIIIVSDMQFDQCVNHYSDNAFEIIRKKYENHGYTLPKIVFWNAAVTATKNVPVTFDESGVVLVSGKQANLYDLIMNGCTPGNFLFNLINSDRYKNIIL